MASTMKHASWRRAAAAIVVLAGTLLLCELVGRVAARIALGLTPKRALAERVAFLAKIPASADRSAGDVAADRTHRRYVDMAYGARYELHPYFGHTLFRDADGANNQGFYTRQTYPYARHDRELVIGIFGGSVAMQVAANGDALAARLGPAIRARGYDTVTVLPFAVGAWRQPQSFFALTYYLDTIDVAIFVDGFNEVIQLDPRHVQVYPARFPASDVFLPLATTATAPYQIADLGKLALVHEAAARATRALNASVLRRSMLVHLFWRAAASRYLVYASALRTEAESTTLDDWHGIEPIRDDRDVERSIDDYLRYYARLVGEAALIAHAAGKPLYHFVQPNQHDRGSKPLSAEEQRSFVTPTWFDVVTPQYRRLETMCDALRASGVDSTFLGHLFAQTDETVYADACCHFNPRGLQLLVDAIADHVLATAELDHLALAREP
jgi:hypothetical protein